MTVVMFIAKVSVYRPSCPSFFIALLSQFFRMYCLNTPIVMNSVVSLLAQSMEKRLKPFLLTALSIILLGFGHFTSAEKPLIKSLTIVASIKPLALITKDIVGDLGEVDVLIPPTRSPHDYALKMSDARKLAKADKVIWFGGDLEQSLAKQIQSLKSKQVVTIGNLEDELPSHGAEEQHDHMAHSDLHLWLSPRAAKDIARIIGEALITDLIDLGRDNDVKTLKTNLEQTLTNYDVLSKDLESIFAPVQGIGFIVYHRAYDALVSQYHLRQIGYISMHPEVPAGVKRIAELEKEVASETKISPVKCLFIESAHQSGAAEQIAKRLSLTAQPLDILGSKDNVSTYYKLIMSIAEDMSDCLKL